MKKTYTLILAALITITSFAQLSSYPGNGNTGAGGAVGNGSLDLSTSINSVTLKSELNIVFHRGTSAFDKILVIYLRTDATGSLNTSTSVFADPTNSLTKAISGYDGAANRSVLTFPSGFTPGFAIAFQTFGEFLSGRVYNLANPVAFLEKSKPSFTNNINANATEYKMTVKFQDIGLDPAGNVGDPVSFQFLATYFDPATGRTDEAIGDPMTGFAGGWTPVTATANDVFNGLLPVVFGDFTGSFAGKNVQLNWNTTTEINTKQFDVQKSGDGAAWKSIGTIATQNSSTGAHYSYLDNNVSDATTYYQIKLTDNDGALSYSPVIIMRKDGIAGITLLGNPAKGVINLNISNSNAGKYNIELYSVDGRKIASQVYNHPGGSGKVSIAVPGAVKGTCIVRIANGTSNQSMKVVVE